MIVILTQEKSSKLETKIRNSKFNLQCNLHLRNKSSAILAEGYNCVGI